MNCGAVEQENIIERYLAGTLAPGLKEEWEEHFFGCKFCSRQLETWCAIEKPIRAMDARIRAEMPGGGTARRSSTWLWAGVAIAACLLIAAGAWFGVSRGPREKPEISYQSAPLPNLAELARFDPPAYAAPSMRGIETKAESEFLAAMSLYRARDYARAIAGLQTSLSLDPDAAPARFFLGACYLLAGRSADGIAALNQVAAGDSPFASEARFYLAKGYLTEGKAAEAVDALRPLAASQNEFSEEARRLIALLAPTR